MRDFCSLVFRVCKNDREGFSDKILFVGIRVRAFCLD